MLLENVSRNDLAWGHQVLVGRPSDEAVLMNTLVPAPDDARNRPPTGAQHLAMLMAERTGIRHTQPDPHTHG